MGISGSGTEAEDSMSRIVFIDEMTVLTDLFMSATDRFPVSLPATDADRLGTDAVTPSKLFGFGFPSLCGIALEGGGGVLLTPQPIIEC